MLPMDAYSVLRLSSFVHAEATPKAVMKVMNIKGLTLYHLKSHLQVTIHAFNQYSCYMREKENDDKNCYIYIYIYMLLKFNGKEMNKHNIKERNNQWLLTRWDLSSVTSLHRRLFTGI